MFPYVLTSSQSWRRGGRKSAYFFFELTLTQGTYFVKKFLSFFQNIRATHRSRSRSVESFFSVLIIQIVFCRFSCVKICRLSVWYAFSLGSSLRRSLFSPRFLLHFFFFRFSLLRYIIFDKNYSTKSYPHFPQKIPQAFFPSIIRIFSNCEGFCQIRLWNSFICEISILVYIKQYSFFVGIPSLPHEKLVSFMKKREDFFIQAFALKETNSAPSWHTHSAPFPPYARQDTHSTPVRRS